MVLFNFLYININKYKVNNDRENNENCIESYIVSADTNIFLLYRRTPFYFIIYYVIIIINKSLIDRKHVIANLLLIK